jgi:hypothetical protein
MGQNIDEILRLLENWRTRLNFAQTGHYARCEGYQRLHEYMGASLVVVSALVSCFLFFDAQKSVSPEVKTIVAVVSILATVLASLQTFLRPGEKSELHRAKAARYGSLKRQIEIQIAKGFHDVAQAANFAEYISVRWDHISDDAPVTPQSVRKRISKLIEEERALHSGRQEVNQHPKPASSGQAGAAA